MAEPRPGPPSAPSAPQCSQLHPPSLEGLIPPSHFVLRPRSLGAELEAERGRVQELEAELKALRGRSQCLEAELEAEKGRSRVLAAELSVLRGRGQRLEAELEAEKGRSQILEMELETLRGRGLGPEGAEPSPEQVLLGRWRQKVFQLLLQVRLQRGQELQLQGQVRSLGAAVAAGSRQVSLLELRLRQAEQERQALSQERLRAEAAEEELGKLGQALSRAGGLGAAPMAVGARGDSGGQQRGGPAGDIGASDRVAPRRHRGWLCPQAVTLVSPPGHQGQGQDPATPRHSVPGPTGDAAPGPRCRHPWGHRGPRGASAPLGTPVTSLRTQGPFGEHCVWLVESSEAI
ncbi:uncharacterized protein [Taeniopygia guttata]|uniref:uncharacterized protein isoform X8 n=1 Tax=Taeniopygia guttata TaxID=59729 RepID=UPI003BB9014D